MPLQIIEPISSWNTGKPIAIVGVDVSGPPAIGYFLLKTMDLEKPHFLS
jgi:hypothetical protein